MSKDKNIHAPITAIKRELVCWFDILSPEIKLASIATCKFAVENKKGISFGYKLTICDYGFTQLNSCDVFVLCKTIMWRTFYLLLAIVPVIWNCACDLELCLWFGIVPVLKKKEPYVAASSKKGLKTQKLPLILKLN